MEILFERQSEIFERIVRDRSGRLFRVRFMVVERDGVLRGRIISCEVVPELRRFKMYDVGFKKKICCLPGRLPFRSVKGQLSKVKSASTSPYFNKFEFLTVIKIRAPSRMLN